MIKCIPLTDEDMTDELAQMVRTAVELARIDWHEFCLTFTGVDLMRILPDDTVRERAGRLYQLGYSSRMTTFPAEGGDEFTLEEESEICRNAWQSFLRANEGEVVLDGEAWPETEPEIVRTAELLFKIGFQSACKTCSIFPDDKVEDRS